MEAGMPGNTRIVVIVPGAAEAEAISASLRSVLGDPFDVAAARSIPPEDSADPRLADPGLLLYDCRMLPEGAQSLHARFPAAHLIAIGAREDAAALEGELDTGASDYLIRDPSGAHLAHLAMKAARLLGHRLPPSGASPREALYRLEENLRQSEIRFAELVQAIPDIVYHLDPEGYIVFVNGSVTTLGYTPRELIGRHFSVLVHPDDLPLVSRKEAIRRRQESRSEQPELPPKLFDERRSGDRRTRGLVLRLLTKPGGPAGAALRIGDVVSYGVIDAMGHYESPGEPELGEGSPDSFRGTVGIIHDVTLHRRSEEMIRVLLQAVDQSPLPIAVMDVAGTVEYVTPLFLRDCGLLPEEVIGRNVAHLTERPSLQGLFAALAEAVSRGSDWRGSLPTSTDRGGSPWDTMYVSPVRDPLGRTSHYIVLLTGDGSASAE